MYSAKSQPSCPLSTVSQGKDGSCDLVQSNLILATASGQKQAVCLKKNPTEPVRPIPVATVLNCSDLACRSIAKCLGVCPSCVSCGCSS